MEGVESPVLGESKDQPLNSKAPKKKYGQSIEASKCYKDKPLPDIQKEDYDWPEDVSDLLAAPVQKLTAGQNIIILAEQDCNK